MSSDDSLEGLLLLDQERFLIDSDLELWVKIEAKRVEPTKDRPHGVKYSLTLHKGNNERIMGFDNAHVIEYGKKPNVRPKRQYDHWHREKDDSGRPYHYTTAGKLMADFWIAVDAIVLRLKEEQQ